MVAEPTPVCPLGSEPMTDSVADGMVSPAPTPSRIRPGRMPVKVVVAEAVDSCHRPPATISSPAATVILVPAARTSSVDSGAMTAMAPAAGSTRIPASSGV